MEPIGKKIRILRRQKNLTQEQLAERLCVSAQAVSKWENEVSVPDIGLLPVIARYFGISMDELFSYQADTQSCQERFIRFMAEHDVLQFGTFRLRSGRISPYYINTEHFRSGSQITALGLFYAECLCEHKIETNLLFAHTRREIPLMVATGMTLCERYGMVLRFCTSEKGIRPSDRVTIIKDTLTSGSTLKNTISRIHTQISVESLSVIVAADRMERGTCPGKTARQETEQKFGIQIFSIVTLEDIIRAMEHDILAGKNRIDRMRQYQETYGGTPC